MRNTARIDLVLRELSKIWKKNPDLRLGQLLWAIAGRDPFYIEDYDMIKSGAEMFCVEAKTDDFPAYWIKMGRNRIFDIKEKLRMESEFSEDPPICSICRLPIDVCICIDHSESN